MSHHKAGTARGKAFARKLCADSLAVLPLINFGKSTDPQSMKIDEPVLLVSYNEVTADRQLS